jgi:hypothetical protein
MNPNPENRNSERFHYKSTITLEQRCTRYRYHGTMYNYSGSGMYLESRYAPRPDTKIRIRIDNLPFDSVPNVYFAKIRWRKQIVDDDSSYSYGIGVKYCESFREKLCYQK